MSCVLVDKRKLFRLERSEGVSWWKEEQVQSFRGSGHASGSAGAPGPKGAMSGPGRQGPPLRGGTASLWELKAFKLESGSLCLTFFVALLGTE